MAETKRKPKRTFEEIKAADLAKNEEKLKNVYAMVEKLEIERAKIENRVKPVRKGREKSEKSKFNDKVKELLDSGVSYEKLMDALDKIEK